MKNEILPADVADSLRECAGCGSLTIFSRCVCCGSSALVPFIRDFYDSLVQCPACYRLGIDDDFDSMDAEVRTVLTLFCPACSHEFECRPLETIRPPDAYGQRRAQSAAEYQRLLFTE